jgi:uncharacterized protein YbjT (DUF2867 family)
MVTEPAPAAVHHFHQQALQTLRDGGLQAVHLLRPFDTFGAPALALAQLHLQQFGPVLQPVDLAPAAAYARVACELSLRQVPIPTQLVFTVI